MHATPPPHCHPAVFAPVVLLVLLPCSVFLSLVLCWQMLCHRALLQEILRAQKALLQAATASQSVQCPAPTTEDRHDPCSGHAMNVDSDHKVLHLRLAHALLGLVDRAQALQWPSASEHRSAFEDFRTDAADRLRCADVSAAWEIPRTRSIRSSSSSRSSTPQSQTQTIFRRSASAPTVPPVPRISCSLRKGTGIQRSSSSAIIDAPYRQATPPTDTKRRKKKLPSSGTAGYCLFYCG